MKRFVILALIALPPFLRAGDTQSQPSGPVVAEVSFDAGKSELPQTGEADLKSLAATLRLWAGSSARIEGHVFTAEAATPTSRMLLSEARANAVHAFLRHKCGVTNVLEVVGYSDSQYKRQRGTERERENARVEVYVKAPPAAEDGPRD